MGAGFGSHFSRLGQLQVAPQTEQVTTAIKIRRLKDTTLGIAMSDKS